MRLREDFAWLLMNAQTALNASRLRDLPICTVSQPTYEVVWFFVMMLPISVRPNKSDNYRFLCIECQQFY